MSIFECPSDGYCWDYREKIVIFDHHVECIETFITIPAGFPVAVCSGQWDEYEPEEFSTEYQCIEAWRMLRNFSHSTGACFAFGGLPEADRDYFGEEKFFWLKWESMEKRTMQRYREGKQPRLHPWERKAMESGEWFSWIEYPKHLRMYSGKPREEFEDGKRWVAIERGEEE